MAKVTLEPAGDLSSMANLILVLRNGPVISSHVMSHVAELGQGQATPA